MGNPHRLDKGVTLQVRFLEGGSVVNIATATTRQIKLRKPGGAVVVKSAGFTTSSGIDGIIQFVTSSGDLDVAGRWVIEGRVASTGFSYHTDTQGFRVDDFLST